jgi:hypothetical protein
VLAIQRAATVANRFRSIGTFNFLRNASGFEGVEYETLGEEGPQTGDAGELARHRRVDLVLKATERSTGGTESEDEPTGKPPTPEAYETVEDRDPGKTKQPEGGVPEHVKPSQFDQWVTMFSDAKWWADAGFSIVGPWVAASGLISTISAASSIVAGMPLSIYSGLRALGRAQNSGEEADAIMGASYGFTAAVMNPSAPNIPSAPDDVSATLFRDGAIEEADRVRSKIQELEKSVRNDPNNQEAAKQLGAFYKLYEGGRKGAEEILNETYRKNLKEHLPPRAVSLHADRHLTWPTPTTREPMEFAMPDGSGQGDEGETE